MVDHATAEPAQPMGQRCTSRLRVRLPARLITVRGTHTAVLCDLSYFGARVALANPPRPGSEVVLQWAKFEAFGLVAWAGRDSFGISFFDPVGPAVLLATRDMDDAEHLPCQRELDRRSAQVFVAGQGRLS